MPDDNADPCGCGWLERESNEPESPVRFDPVLNEYEIVRSDGGTLSVYHCPFCGGRVPESKRKLMFAHISQREQDRLREMIANPRTIEDAIQKLGQPDSDTCGSVDTPEREGRPPTFELQRQLRFEKLSDTADVYVTERKDGRVSIMFLGKYIGLPKEQ